MIHPSYAELMKVVNEDAVEIGEEPVVNSRYSIFLTFCHLKNGVDTFFFGIIDKATAVDNNNICFVLVIR